MPDVVSLWTDEYLSQRMKDREVSIAVTPTGWEHSADGNATFAHYSGLGALMQLRTGAMADCISPSLTQTK